MSGIGADSILLLPLLLRRLKSTVNKVPSLRDWLDFCQSRSDDTLLTVSFNLRLQRWIQIQRWIQSRYDTTPQMLYPSCETSQGVHSSCVRVLLRRLKSTVNRVPSLRDFTLIIFISILFLNCSNKQKEIAITDEQNIISDTATFQKQDIFTVSKDLLKEGFIDDMYIFIENPHTLVVLTDNDLTYFPLGVFKNVEDFRKKYSHFKEEKQIIVREFDGFIDTAYKFLYKESFIKIHYKILNEFVCDRFYGEELNIVSGRITNKEIQLVGNICIGMSKNDLLKKFFSDGVLSMYDFSKVDILINSSSPGDIGQSYIFVNNILKEIIMESDYDWIPFDL